MEERQIVGVPLGDIEKNPFRRSDTYVLQPLKIEELKEGIKETGFWENIVGRRRQEGKVEIAYGYRKLSNSTKGRNEPPLMPATTKFYQQTGGGEKKELLRLTSNNAIYYNLIN